MRILDNLFGEHALRLQRALGRTSERHSLLLGNLANANTPGYKRKDMDFALKLSEADDGLQLRTTDPRHIDDDDFSDFDMQEESAEDGRSITMDGNSVSLEDEVAALAETQLHYNAISLASKRMFQGLKDVIREGR